MNQNKKYQELAEKHSNIYWLHDQENFEDLAKNASLIYQSLGYSSQQSLEVGQLISEAYQLSDYAELKRINNNIEAEKKYYNQVKDKFLKVETILNIPVSIAQYQVNWWMYFRHRHWPLITLNLFLQHSLPFGLNGFLKGGYLTYYLIQAALAHNKRDKLNCQLKLEKYWELVIKDTRYPFIG
ncbi:hypothetical protein [Cyanothece sp. BG0011]|uniref:hypothetical protein n=1 Tax=Cyanothece sp. BG0011 TaxID=2082950 RepID=UPI0013001D4C|nr:hypothetical protein [Cyanothece sp. BG0011]